MSLILAWAVAALGGLASVDAGPFYAQLARPAWSPPGWLFGPVWSLLYTLMAVAAWLVWRAAPAAPAGPQVGSALALYGAQLAVNALWSWLFFAWQLGAWALADVLLLAALIVATMHAFRRVRPLAAWLLLPYLAWVSFAGLLTLDLWRRNPALLG